MEFLRKILQLFESNPYLWFLILVGVVFPMLGQLAQWIARKRQQVKRRQQSGEQSWSSQDGGAMAKDTPRTEARGELHGEDQMVAQVRRMVEQMTGVPMAGRREASPREPAAAVPAAPPSSASRTVVRASKAAPLPSQEPGAQRRDLMSMEPLAIQLRDVGKLDEQEHVERLESRLEQVGKGERRRLGRFDQQGVRQGQEPGGVHRPALGKLFGTNLARMVLSIEALGPPRCLRPLEESPFAPVGLRRR
jgi:hypothetical protein